MGEVHRLCGCDLEVLGMERPETRFQGIYRTEETMVVGVSVIFCPKTLSCRIGILRTRSRGFRG